MKMKLQEAIKKQPSPAVSDIVIREIKVEPNFGIGGKAKVICLKVRWGQKWKYVHIFKSLLFYGNGSLSGWYSKNLRQQVKMLEEINSGMQQGGEDPDPYLTLQLRESIRTALGL